MVDDALQTSTDYRVTVNDSDVCPTHVLRLIILSHKQTVNEARKALRNLQMMAATEVGRQFLEFCLRNGEQEGQRQMKMMPTKSSAAAADDDDDKDDDDHDDDDNDNDFSVHVNYV